MGCLLHPVLLLVVFGAFCLCPGFIIVDESTWRQRRIFHHAVERRQRFMTAQHPDGTLIEHKRRDLAIVTPLPFPRAETRLYMAAPTKTGADLIQSKEDFLQRVLFDYSNNESIYNDSENNTTGTQDESGNVPLDSMRQTTPRKPVLVFWTAPWCGPCRLSIPIVKDVIKQYENVLQCYEICTDDLPDVAASHGVASIPTLQLYSQDGRLVDTIIGCVAKSVLCNAIDKVLEESSEAKEA